MSFFQLLLLHCTLFWLLMARWLCLYASKSGSYPTFLLLFSEIWNWSPISKPTSREKTLICHWYHSSCVTKTQTLMGTRTESTDWLIAVINSLTADLKCRLTENFSISVVLQHISQTEPFDSSNVKIVFQTINDLSVLLSKRTLIKGFLYPNSKMGILIN